MIIAIQGLGACFDPCVCVFPWACHDEVEKGLISPRKCFSSLSHAEVWRNKVHRFLQPPGHRLKCELWLRPLLEVFLLTAPTSATPPLIHPLNTSYPRHHLLVNPSCSCQCIISETSHGNFSRSSTNVEEKPNQLSRAVMWWKGSVTKQVKNLQLYITYDIIVISPFFLIAKV